MVNITGGKDLKLFEVDEAVNKVRAEVDPEAELIIGAITDTELDGKMRVSIVATSLDGQQPETKSVINMVHRIQNRNPGYSDFSTSNGTAAFSFSNNNSNPISHGANALKLENELASENISQQSVNNDINQVNNEYHEELLKNQEAENIVEETSNDEISFTKEASSLNEQSDNSEALNNDLSEFGVDNKSPDLFNNDTETFSSDDLLSSENEDQEDDLEIPAFLRRQKN